jgi:hypothetical protein
MEIATARALAPDPAHFSAGAASFLGA